MIIYEQSESVETQKPKQPVSRSLNHAPSSPSLQRKRYPSRRYPGERLEPNRPSTPPNGRSIQLKQNIEQTSRMDEQDKSEPRANRTGIPTQLKENVEAISGMSFDNVRVHYNSDKPAKLGALAYTQGSEIHVGAGQERHLPHELWHVVQQSQGRVRPTMQMKGLQVNDELVLEKEADKLGFMIKQNNSYFIQDKNRSYNFHPLKSNFVMQKKALTKGKLNIAGEHHRKQTEEVRRKECAYTLAVTGGQYFTESEFTYKTSLFGDEIFGDSPILRAATRLSVVDNFIALFQEFASVNYADPGVFNFVVNKLPRTLDQFYYEMDRINADNYDINLLNGQIQYIEKSIVEKTIPIPFAEIEQTLELIVSTFENVVLQRITIKSIKGSLANRRSKAMHKAAAANSKRFLFATTGVWKIGDKHIDEVKEYKKQDEFADYEILTQEEFEEGFNQWLRENSM